VVAERSTGERRSDEPLYLITDPLLHPIAGNLSQWPDAEELRPGWISFPIEVHRQGAVEMHQARATGFALPGGYRLLGGGDLWNANLFRSRILKTLAWASLLTIAMGVVGGLFMTRNMLRRVDAVNRTSERIIHGDLTQRVPLTGSRDEFDQLASNLNAMLD